MGQIWFISQPPGDFETPSFLKPRTIQYQSAIISTTCHNFTFLISENEQGAKSLKKKITARIQEKHEQGFDSMLTPADLCKYFKSSELTVVKKLLETVHGMVLRDTHTAIRNSPHGNHIMELTAPRHYTEYDAGPVQ